MSGDIRRAASRHPRAVRDRGRPPPTPRPPRPGPAGPAAGSAGRSSDGQPPRQRRRRPTRTPSASTGWRVARKAPTSQTSRQLDVRAEGVRQRDDPDEDESEEHRRADAQGDEHPGLTAALPRSAAASASSATTVTGPVTRQDRRTTPGNPRTSCSTPTCWSSSSAEAAVQQTGEQRDHQQTDAQQRDPPRPGGDTAEDRPADRDRDRPDQEHRQVRPPLASGSRTRSLRPSVVIRGSRRTRRSPRTGAGRRGRRSGSAPPRS